MLLHFLFASSLAHIAQGLDLIFVYPSDLLSYHVHTQLHPQVKASFLLPPVHDDSATTLVTRTTVTACQTDKKLVGWAHALKESTEEINVCTAMNCKWHLVFPFGSWNEDKCDGNKERRGPKEKRLV